MDSRTIKKQIAFSIILGVLIAIILMGISVFTQRRIKETQENDAQQYLSEIVTQYDNTVSIKIEGDFQTLSALSTFIEKSESFDLTNIEARLQTESSRNQFVRMGFVTTDKIGYFYDTDGTAHLDVDLSDETFLDNIFAGETVLSNPRKDRFSDDTVLVYAVPIYRDGVISGALLAISNASDFSSIITQEIFNGNASLDIIDGDGNVILRSDNSLIPSNSTNLFESTGLSFDFQNDKNFSECDIGGTEHWATIADIGINNWYLVCLIPKSYLNGGYDRLITNFIIVMCCVTLLFTALFLYIYQIIKRSRRQMSRLAYYDSLTGLYNRHRFMSKMTKLISESPDYSFVFMNIKGFKFINDFYGYSKGNKALRKVASILNSHMDPEEICCRDSSDRFAILLHCRNREVIIQKLTAIQNDIFNYKFVSDDSYHIRCNFGITTFDELGDDTSLDYETLMSDALLALSSISNSEVAFFAFYDQKIREAETNRIHIENNMASALENHGFVMHLQPKYHLETETIHSAEALVRWYLPTGEIVYPNNFIPIFEKNGFISKLDIYMLEEACKQLARWEKSGHPLVPLSVNQSRMFFYDSEYLDKFNDIITKYDIDPSLIILEVTESVAVTNIEQIKGVIDKVHAMGFRISMDDFGSGYSSLNILRELPIDELKLDKVFLDATENTVRSETIMEGIVRLAKELSISTVAEGVETKEQVDFLKSISCDVVQGFYFAKPMPVRDFEELMDYPTSN